MKLDIKHASCGYGSKTVLRDISFDVETGDILCLLGPNGVGKTTLFKSILGFLKLQEGEILLDGENIQNWPRSRLARTIAYVPQAHTPPFPFNVLDVVIMGRTAHLGVFASPTKKDISIAEEALETLNVSFLKDRIYTEISGGERQMVLIARALTQQPQILVMDEPTSNLDFGNQIRVLEQINRLSRKGLTVIMTSHSPNHAFICSTKVLIMQRDSVFKQGSATDVMTEETLKAAYGINLKITSVENGYGEKVNTRVPPIS